MVYKARRKRSASAKDKAQQLKFIPLGGVGEIGKNMYILEYGDDIIVIDGGLKFPDQELPGIDCIVPDISYLEANREKVLALIITHGHEDHTGGLPYVLQRLNVPLYGTRLTLGLVDNKLKEDHPLLRPDMNEVKAGDVIEIGPFKIRFIAVCHSIPDGVALSVETPLGRVVHTGDFKLDATPIDGRVTDYGAFAEEGGKGVLLMMSDSTNAERKGFTPSERLIGGTLDYLYRNYRTKRLIISSFASNVHRIQQVIDGAARFNRKIAFLGRSMIRNVELASSLGYLRLEKKMIVQPEDIGKVPENQLVVMTTGSQGEPFSGLVMMSRGEHRQVTLGEKDAVFLLASAIPGNEKLVNNTINRLFAAGCEVVYESDRLTHVSGHASSEELKIMLNIIRPQYFVPIHGEYRHMARHSQLAQSVGIPGKNVFIMTNGSVLTFPKAGRPHVRDKVHSGAVIIDGNAVGEIKSRVMKERRELAEDGIIVVSMAVTREGTLLTPVTVDSRGFFVQDESRDVLQEIRAASENALKEFTSGKPARRGERLPKSPRNSKGGFDAEALARNIKIRIGELVRRRNASYAEVMPLISVAGDAPDTQNENAANWIENEL